MIMGFLAAKGFLHSNEKIPLYPNGHINLKDAIWAGRFVEPRILEVLPAAYERFKKHFSGDADAIQKLEQIIGGIKQPNDHKIEFYGISIEKLKPWFFIRLQDGRSKPLHERKVSKTFRFKPETVDTLKKLKAQSGQTETEILEKLVAAAKLIWLLGISAALRMLIVCHCFIEDDRIIRIISARKANKNEQKQYGY